MMHLLQSSNRVALSFCNRRAYQKTGYIGHMPSLSTFRRRVMELDRIEVIKYRYGESAARAEGRSATSKIEVSRILERAEMDAAHFNIGLLSNDKHFIGKPSIFFIIDCHSRAILGYAIHVGKQTETPGAVIHALRYAISIKNDPLYPVHGLPSLIVMDQGPGYASNQTVEFLNKLKVEIQVTATKMGWGKPFMERFIGTSRTKFFQGLDGYLGKLDKSRYSDETIKKSAKHTIEEFRIKFSEFIIDYHNSPHSGLNGKTPLQVWRESAKQYHPIIPDDMGADTLLRGLREQKTLTHVTGINCQYQVFNSKELQNLYHRLLKNQVPGKHNQKIKVTILRDPLDAGGISVVDPSTKRLIDVPNVNKSAPGVSFAELNSGRRGTCTAEEAPLLCDNKIREGYSKSGRKSRKGPDVPLETQDNAINLHELLSSQVNETTELISSLSSVHTSTDEDDDEYTIE